MSKERLFFKQTITVTVLSDVRLEWNSLHDVANAITREDYIGISQEASLTVLTQAELNDELQKMRSIDSGIPDDACAGERKAE